MNKLDIINSLFMAVSAVLIWKNVYRLWKDRKIRGVSIIPTIWFCCSGMWHLYFYASINAVWSSLACGVVLAANVVWLAMAVIYRSYK